MVYGTIPSHCVGFVLGAEQEQLWYPTRKTATAAAKERFCASRKRERERDMRF
jgi:hypothetical protein